ncbi:MAG: hypothetical protein ISR69_03750 [Gammaproteobacteria bacterium]|nr:hypothetical protein [Gammaproteobacteria bacterium]
MFKILSSFVGFLLAFLVSIAIFAPDRIPAGWGFEAVPVEVNINSDLGSQLFSSITGKSKKNVRIKNISMSPIYNLQVNLLDADKKLKKQFVADKLTASGILTLGWAEEWDVQEGDQVAVKAAAYKEVLWAL